MTDNPPVTDQPTTDHASVTEHIGGHVDEHMSGDHGQAEARLGPIDWAGWGYAALGVLAGLLVVVAFWLAIT
jgi:hypothetical protein